VHRIKQLLEEGIISPNSRMVHRNIYATWISKATGPGKPELLYPHLDWKSIWRNTAALKNTKINETVFLFNQRLLPTRARDHRIDSTTDPTCCFCNQEPESDEHIMLHCPSREISTLWFERTLRTHGCSTMDVLHGRAALNVYYFFLVIFAICLLLFCSVFPLYQLFLCFCVINIWFFFSLYICSL
jgi:hypothetical protein